VTDYSKIAGVLERMEKIGMPFLIHGEEVAADVDIFDREAAFIDRRLSKWIKQFPGLRMVLEHLSSKEGVDFVGSAAPQVGGTITPYHLSLTRTDWLGHGLKPMMYAMPVIKAAKDRAALRQAATSGAGAFFLGTDSAPHPLARKLATSGAPGIFNAPVALATYAKVFEEEGALDKLEAFASLNGPKHYRLPPNDDTITLEKSAWTAPAEIAVSGADERALVYRGGETIEWKVVDG
jgi:dihydroorotase